MLQELIDSGLTWRQLATAVDEAKSTLHYLMETSAPDPKASIAMKLMALHAERCTNKKS